MPRRSPSPRTVLGLATTILLVTSLAPSRYTAWISWFRGPFMTLMAPASGPVTGLSAWLRPASSTSPFESASDSELQSQVEELNIQLTRYFQQIQQMQERITEYERGTPYPQPVPTRKLEASRVSANLAAGTFDVNRGRRQGVVGGTVAAARQTDQLVGIVTAAGPMVSTIHLLTDKHLEPNLMVGVVMPGQSSSDLTPEGFTHLPRAQFRPTGEGTLLADAVGADEAARIQKGNLVRLDDETWPSAAAMLILGQVSRVEPTVDPLFYRVYVTPLADLARLRSIILFIPENTSSGRESGGGGAP
jgi:cell shape-determining protein MreC